MTKVVNIQLSLDIESDVNHRRHLEILCGIGVMKVVAISLVNKLAKCHCVDWS